MNDPEERHTPAIAPELQTGPVRLGHERAASKGVHEGAALRLEAILREYPFILLGDGRLEEHDAAIRRRRVDRVRTRESCNRRCAAAPANAKCLVKVR